MRTIIRDNYTPKAGDYHERIVRDEVNNRQWIFDCDGVFTDITDTTSEIEIVNELGPSTTAVTSQKLVTDNVGILQQEIDELKNSPDVVDIVATYAALQAYDTSSLGTDDIVRVLRDEMHDGASTYYRWNDPNAGWNFIGTVGDYYTTGQVDTLLASKQDTLTAGANISIDSNNVISAIDTTYSVLTTDDYNWNSTTQDETEPFDSVALWKLDDGLYKVTTGVNAYIAKRTPTPLAASNGLHIKSDWKVFSLDERYSYATVNNQLLFTVSLLNVDGTLIGSYPVPSEGTIDTYIARFIMRNAGVPTSAPTDGNKKLAIDTTNNDLYLWTGTAWIKFPKTDTTYSNFVGTDGTTAGTAGLVPAPATTDAGKFLKADGTWDTAGSAVNVVQATGTSTTDVMSQDATTEMVYSNSSLQLSIKIGNTAISYEADPNVEPKNANIAIGYKAQSGEMNTSRGKCIAVGSVATAHGINGIAVGGGAQSGYLYNDGANIAIGPGAKACSVFHSFDAQYMSAISIGPDAVTRKSYDIAIGDHATADTSIGAIAIGPYSSATITGEVNIGSTNTTYGYNSSNYRLLSGVYDGQSAHDAVNKGQLDAASSYSTTEVDTGGTWIDGSRIYKKTIDTGTLPNNTTKTVAHGISNLGTIIKIEGFASSGSEYIPLPFVWFNPSSTVSVYATSSNIEIVTATDQSNRTVSYVTIYYTKSS